MCSGHTVNAGCLSTSLEVKSRSVGWINWVDSCLHVPLVADTERRQVKRRERTNIESVCAEGAFRHLLSTWLQKLTPPTFSFSFEVWSHFKCIEKMLATNRFENALFHTKCDSPGSRPSEEFYAIGCAYNLSEKLGEKSRLSLHHQPFQTYKPFIN